jgi:hypothetical protein
MCFRKLCLRGAAEAEGTLRLTVSQYVLVWDLRPDINSVLNLRSCFCDERLVGEQEVGKVT